MWRRWVRHWILDIFIKNIKIIVYYYEQTIMTAAVIGFTSALIYITGSIINPLFITFFIVSFVVLHQMVNDLTW